MPYWVNTIIVNMRTKKLTLIFGTTVSYTRAENVNLSIQKYWAREYQNYQNVWTAYYLISN